MSPAGAAAFLRIPHRLANAVGLAEGCHVELTVEDGRLIVRPCPLTLAVLLAGITAENLPESADDVPCGAERL